MSTWEDQANISCALSSGLSCLDVNAPEFVPGQPFNYSAHNINTSPLVPESNEDVVFESSEKDLTDEIELSEEPTEIKCSIASTKDTLNIVFIGHVDAGKSTIGGHILYLTGMVDKRTLEKYEREAKEKNRETWYLSWALDTNPEERDKGKTVECGRAYFETPTKRFVLIDAPGHRAFIPNMISGASAADVAVLVISARKGEFETGFEKGGQTREHALLVKTAGVKHLIVLINKMDDMTVLWDELRYNECRDKILPYLRKIGFDLKTNVYCLPCSGFDGSFLRDIPSEEVCSWYRGPSLLEHLDSLPSLDRNIDGPLRLIISDKCKDVGMFVSGKIESGNVSRGQVTVLLPNKINVEILQVFVNEVEVDRAVAGEVCKLKVKNVEEDDISTGFCLCPSNNPCQVSNLFIAQLMIMDYKSIICSGFLAVLHIHTCIKEVKLQNILYRVDKKTNEKTDISPRFIKQDDAAMVVLEVTSGPICLETYKDFTQLGRFILRNEGKTTAVGKVVKILKCKEVEN